MKDFTITETRFPKDKNSKLACFVSCQFRLEAAERVEFYRSSKKKDSSEYDRYKSAEIQGENAFVELVGVSVFRGDRGNYISQDLVVPGLVKKAILDEAAKATKSKAA